MPQGILILGLNGCGKTTIGRILSESLGFFRMDAEDYYFPIPGNFTVSRSEEEVHRLMEADTAANGSFVLSCVRCHLSETLLQQVCLAVVLRASPEIRAKRILQREVARFGNRVFPGGDLYESQQAFRAFAAGRTEAVVDQSLLRLSCPILELDASLPPQTIVNQILCKLSPDDILKEKK